MYAKSEEALNASYKKYIYIPVYQMKLPISLQLGLSMGTFLCAFCVSGVVHLQGV